MKRFLFFFVLLLLGASMAHAAISVPLYPDFKKATVYLHNRTKIIAPMNYDLGEDKMYYKDGLTVMELSQDNPVDSIVWAGEHSFILRDGKFCEKVKLGGKEVLVQWRLKKVSIGKDGALGMNTQSNNVTEMNLAGMGMYGAGETGSVENFKFTNSNTYFIPVSGGYKKVTSLKHLYKCFPETVEAAKQFVRENNLELTNHQDFMRLISFCLEVGK